MKPRAVPGRTSDDYCCLVFIRVDLVCFLHVAPDWVRSLSIYIHCILDVAADWVRSCFIASDFKKIALF